MKKLVVFLSLIGANIGIFSQEVSSLKLKKYRVGYFDEKLKESSGLAWLGGKLYSINDSGNLAEYYEINP